MPSPSALSSHLGAGLIMLPWETTDDAKSILVEPLMEKVLGLAIAEVRRLHTVQNVCYVVLYRFYGSCYVWLI